MAEPDNVTVGGSYVNLRGLSAGRAKDLRQEFRASGRTVSTVCASLRRAMPTRPINAITCDGRRIMSGRCDLRAWRRCVDQSVPVSAAGSRSATRTVAAIWPVTFTNVLTMSGIASKA